jgi:chromosome segregation ATPase
MSFSQRVRPRVRGPQSVRINIMGKTLKKRKYKKRGGTEHFNKGGIQSKSNYNILTKIFIEEQRKKTEKQYNNTVAKLRSLHDEYYTLKSNLDSNKKEFNDLQNKKDTVLVAMGLKESKANMISKLNRQIENKNEKLKSLELQISLLEKQVNY